MGFITDLENMSGYVKSNPMMGQCEEYKVEVYPRLEAREIILMIQLSFRSGMSSQLNTSLPQTQVAI